MTDTAFQKKGDSPGAGETVDHLFRYRSGQMIASLAGIFGLQNLELVEDAVQDAMVQAVRQWPHRGVPDNPAGWVFKVARNRAIDSLRRKVSWEGKEEEIRAALEQNQWSESVENLSEDLEDDQLKMMFACCHPAITLDAQVALTLKSVGGFNIHSMRCAQNSSVIEEKRPLPARATVAPSNWLSVPRFDDFCHGV